MNDLISLPCILRFGTILCWFGWRMLERGQGEGERVQTSLTQERQGNENPREAAPENVSGDLHVPSKQQCPVNGMAR